MQQPSSGASSAPVDTAVLDQMRHDWDRRARENARHYIATANEQWNEEEYYNSGRLNVFHEVLTDLGNVCKQKNARAMKILEIGCGTGRMTRAFSEVFGDVYAVDISGEMIERGRQALAGIPNVHMFQNSGADLRVLGDVQVDFAFSYIVFQHIPSREVIYNYVREVYRVLRPGALFKFQVQGADLRHEPGADTWQGVYFTEEEAFELARQTGFELRYRHGAGEQYFWLWFFKPEAPGLEPPPSRKDAPGRAGASTATKVGSFIGRGLRNVLGRARAPIAPTRAR